MHGDTTPIWFLSIFAVLAWATWMWMHYQVRSRISEFFAKRRHIRRMRNQGKQVLGDPRHRRA